MGVITSPSQISITHHLEEVVDISVGVDGIKTMDIRSKLNKKQFMTSSLPMDVPRAMMLFMKTSPMGFCCLSMP